MAKWLKRGATMAAEAEHDCSVRDTVETILADIDTRGDAAVRDLGIEFDGWDRDDYRLARQAWNSFGEAVVAEDDGEMVDIADDISSEHVQAMTRDHDYFLNHMTNYGALCLGPRTNVLRGPRVQSQRPCQDQAWQYRRSSRT